MTEVLLVLVLVAIVLLPGRIIAAETEALRHQRRAHEWRVTDLIAANSHEVERRRRLVHAVRALYLAGRWSCDRPCEEARLWTEVRDAAGLEPGTATAAGMGVSE